MSRKDLILADFLAGKDVKCKEFSTEGDVLLFGEKPFAWRLKSLPPGYFPLYPAEMYLQILFLPDALEDLLKPLHPAAFSPSEARFLYSFPPKELQAVWVEEWRVHGGCAQREFKVTREEARKYGIPPVPVPIHEVVTKTNRYLYYLDWKGFSFNHYTRNRLAPGEALLHLRIVMKDKTVVWRYWRWISRPEVRYIQKHRLDLYEEKEFKPHPRLPRTSPEAKYLFAYLLALRKLRREGVDKRFVEYCLLEGWAD